MYTLDDIKPYIDGGHELGYRKGRKEGLEKGLEKGMEKGREEERMSIVLKMKSLNIPAKTIAEVTGISAEEMDRYNFPAVAAAKPGCTSRTRCT